MNTGNKGRGRRGCVQRRGSDQGRGRGAGCGLRDGSCRTSLRRDSVGTQEAAIRVDTEKAVFRDREL